MTDESYEGWTNWDTYCVGTWLLNTEYDYELFNGHANNPRLAEMIKMHIENGFGPKGLYRDGPFLDNVNWEEVAEAFAED